jgi:dipeptidase E
MKFLLTSGGISNDSIRNTLVDLLGKPIAESSALCIPTAMYGMPGGAAHAWRFLRGVNTTPLCDVGWKSLGVLELTALPSINEEQWVPMVQEADALLVGGGDVMYLCYWMRQSGLANLLPELPDAVYVGVSAGSMVVTPNFGEAYDDWFCREPPASNLPAYDDRALGLVDFSLFPHLDYPTFPQNSMANAEKWATMVPVPTYAIDDQTAIKVNDGSAEVISEGHWKRFTP